MSAGLSRSRLGPGTTGGALSRRQLLGEIVGAHWRREQESLAKRTAEILQQLEFLRRLDTLGDDIHAQCRAQR